MLTILDSLLIGDVERKTRIEGGKNRPAIPAPKSALWSHPCVAVPSAQVFLVYREVAGT